MSLNTDQIKKSFPFEYVGGGHFRRKGSPQGKPAETFHGHEILNLAFDHAIAAMEEFHKTNESP